MKHKHKKNSVSLGHSETKDQIEETNRLQDNGERIPFSNEDIQRRAYQIHEQKGGSDIDNWLEAEQSLKENAKV